MLQTKNKQRIDSDSSSEDEAPQLAGPSQHMGMPAPAPQPPQPNPPGRSFRTKLPSPQRLQPAPGFQRSKARPSNILRKVTGKVRKRQIEISSEEGSPDPREKSSSQSPAEVSRNKNMPWSVGKPPTARKISPVAKAIPVPSAPSTKIIPESPALPTPKKAGTQQQKPKQEK